MKPKVKKPAKDIPQIDKFRAAAREAECDDDEAAFDERLKTLAKAAKPGKNH